MKSEAFPNIQINNHLGALKAIIGDVLRKNQELILHIY